MDSAIPDKVYFRIGEVSRILGVEPYVVRYWESEFKTIKPVRTGADQRRYRKKDVEELLLVKKLLYEEGFTIAGARKRLGELKKNGSGGNDLDRLIDIKKGLQELRKMID
ncbi:MAG: MerR family transcriptional regulator [Syntrophales bacterium]